MGNLSLGEERLLFFPVPLKTTLDLSNSLFSILSLTLSILRPILTVVQSLIRSTLCLFLPLARTKFLSLSLFSECYDANHVISLNQAFLNLHF
jgi:hypothetical protein